MTDDKIREIVAYYQKLLTKLDIPAQQLKDYSQYCNSIKVTVGHAHWMLYQIELLLQQGRRDKAFRWLGFIQGVLFAQGMCSVNQLKNDSRPDHGH